MTTTINVAGDLYIQLPDEVLDRLDAGFLTMKEGQETMARTVQEISDKVDALGVVVGSVATAVAPFPQLVNDFEALRTQLKGNLSPENQALVDAMSDKLDVMNVSLQGVVTQANAATADAADGIDEAAPAP